MKIRDVMSAARRALSTTPTLGRVAKMTPPNPPTDSKALRKALDIAARNQRRRTHIPRRYR